MTTDVPFGIISASMKRITTTDGEDVVGWQISYKRNDNPQQKILFALDPKDALRLAERLSEHAQSLMRPPTAH